MTLANAERGIGLYIGEVSARDGSSLLPLGNATPLHLGGGLLVGLVVLSCAVAPSRPQGPARHDLPTASDIPGISCAGLGYVPPMRLFGSSEADPAAWVIWTGHTRIPIMWPSGFYATFDPALEVHSPDGGQVGRAGDDVSTSPTIWPGYVVCAGDKLVQVYRAIDQPTQ